MEILFLLIAVPAFLIYSRFRKSDTPPSNNHFNQDDNSPSTSLRLQNHLEELAQKHSSAGVKKGIRIAIMEIDRLQRTGALNLSSSETTKQDMATFTEKGTPVIPRGAHSNPSHPTAPQPTTTNATGEESLSSPAFTDPSGLSSPFDRINTLLLGGAFLVILSALFFINSDLLALDGGSKFALITLLTLSFYGAGLLLVKLNEEFRPAALTLSGIGVAVLPLLVYAYDNFVGSDLTMLGQTAVASMILTAFSAVTYFVFRSEIFIYGALGGLLGSIILTMTSAEADMRATSAVAALSSFTMFYLGIWRNPFKQHDSDNLDPASAVGAIGITIATLMALTSIQEPWAYSAPAIGLIATLSVGVCLLTAPISVKNAFLALSAFLWTIFGAVVLQTSSDGWLEGTAYGLMIAAVIQSVFSVGVLRDIEDNKDPLTYGFMASAGLSVAVAFISDSALVPVFMTAALLILLLARAALAKQPHEEAFSGTIFILPIVIPGLILRYGTEADEILLATIALFGTAGISVAAHYAIRSFTTLKDRVVLMNVSSLAGLAYASIAGFTSYIQLGDDYRWLPVVAIPVLMLFVVEFSYRAKNAIAGITLGILSYILALTIHFRLLENIEGDSLFWIPMSVVALIHAGVARIINAEKTLPKQAWLLSSSTGFTVAGVSIYAENPWVTVVLTAILAGILFDFGAQAKEKIAHYVAIYVATGAVWLTFLQVDQLTNPLILSLLWAIPSAVVAASELSWKLPRPEQLTDLTIENLDRAHMFILFALATATLPVSILALDSAVSSATELALLGVNLAILLLGVTLRVRIIAYWGLVSLVINVLYQTRDFIAAIPRQLIIFVVGLSLIATAIYLISRDARRKK